MREPRLEEAQQRLQEGGKILLSRLRYIGDVVLTLPLVQQLRRLLPRVEIHYLAEPGPLEVLRGHPDVDRLWCAERRASHTWSMAAALRRQRFDVVVDLFANPRSAVLLRATGAPVRIGEARRLRRHLYTHWRPLAPGKSAIEHHLEPLDILGLEGSVPERPRLVLFPDETEPAEEHWRRLSRTPPRLLVHLAATQPAKEWPTEHSLRLLQALHAQGWTLLLTTAPHRPETSVTVAAAVSGVQRLPVLPLRRLLGYAATADAVLSVDGAVVHCSVALGTPTLALFGPTIPNIWFPYEAFGPFRVLHAGVDCSHCDRFECPTKACMAAISVESVAQTLQDILRLASCRREGSA